MPAQRLPSLPVDPAIQKGTLRCGVTYYMVKNAETKGFADFAVVRRGEAPTAATRSQFQSGFLARNGVGPRPEGYFRDHDGSTVFHFDRVPVYDADVLDSTLLVSFSVVAASRADEAVIISGDIDPVELKKKLDVFSMMVPPRFVGNSSGPDYVWEPSVMPSIVLRQEPSGERGTVRVAYASPRTPHDLMNTAQALVLGIFGREFQTIASHRLERNLRDAGVPYERLELVYTNSTDTGGDEEYAIAVHTGKAYLDAAMKVISSTLASLDGFGTGAGEFQDAKRVMMADMLRREVEPLSNRKYIDRCTAHFLYGANLAPYSEETRLFARKSVADSTETRLFNNFSSALLGQLSNLTLEYRAALDSLDEDAALFNYNLAYLYGSTFQEAKDYSWRRSDTLGLEGEQHRVRIKQTKAEPVSGGEMWTFSNGIRVVYRQVPGSGMFNYALLLNGGLSGVQGLVEGEGGYFADMLSLYDVGGLPAANFRDLLAVSGIQMDASVGTTSMTLSGSAPRQKLPTLLKCLLSLANGRSVNRSEFAAYSRNEALREEAVTDRLYSLMYPGFTWTIRKRPGSLTPETQVKAERYFEARFSHVNDGMLVLVGDLDEGTVKKVLSRYLGGFRTQKGTTSRRSIRYQPRSGTTTYTVDGPVPGIYVLMDVPLPLTSVNYLAADMVRETLRRHVVRALSEQGFSVDVQCGFQAYPEERFRMEVTCLPASVGGLSEGIPEPDVLKAVSAVRSGILSAAREPVPSRDLAALKALVLTDVTRDLSRPETIVSSVVARYGVGKDLVTRYKENIASVTSDKVAQILSQVAAGGRVEYIVK
ncbi:MAG: insulinase family protein [Bacteroidales bacterium]|nr:insulinase family protein [Bacteroidales bacterium]